MQRVERHDWCLRVGMASTFTTKPHYDGLSMLKSEPGKWLGRWTKRGGLREDPPDDGVTIGSGGGLDRSIRSEASSNWGISAATHAGPVGDTGLENAQRIGPLGKSRGLAGLAAKIGYIPREVSGMKPLTRVDVRTRSIPSVRWLTLAALHAAIFSIKLLHPGSVRTPGAARTCASSPIMPEPLPDV